MDKVAVGMYLCVPNVHQHSCLVSLLLLSVYCSTDFLCLITYTYLLIL